MEGTLGFYRAWVGVVVFPVEEDYPVGVLLQRPRVPQVGKLGVLVLTAFQLPV